MSKYQIVTDEDAWPQDADSLELLIKELKENNDFTSITTIYEMKDVTPENLKEMQEAYANGKDETPVSNKPLPNWWERNPRRN